MTGFIFTQAYEFDWPVTVKYPGAEASFTARFRLPDEAEEARLKGPYPEGADIPEIFAEDRKRMEAVLVGWSGITLEGGAPFEVSPENKEKLLSQRVIVKALWLAFWGALNGDLRAKN